MKLPNKLPRAPQGSFGIPEDLRGIISKEERRGAEERQGEKAEAEQKIPPVSEDDGFKTDSDNANKTDEPASTSDFRSQHTSVDPIAELKKIGIELTEDDLHQYCFKGYLEKEVTIMKTKKRDLTVTLRTLTGEQYVIVDRKIADVVPLKPMTREGLDNLRALYILSYGVTALSGRPIVRIVTGGTPKDQETIGDEAFEALNQLASGILNKIIRIHSIFSTALHLLVEQGDSPFLSKE